MQLKNVARKAKTAFAILAILAGVHTAGTAWAEYPERPINVIIGFKAGGNTDASGRAATNPLQRLLGSPVVVVNKPGASSMIAAKAVADARPDGYTLWFGSASTLMLQRSMGKTEVDLFEDFVPIGFTAELVPTIAVPKDSPFGSIEDLITAARANPGKLRWSHGGRGSAYMAAGAGFVAANELDVVAVPFSGGKGSRTAIIGGQVDFGIVGESDGEKFASKLRVLAAFRHNRDGSLHPDTPTLGEKGIKFIQLDSIVGIFAPKGTPEDVIETLQAALAEAKLDETFRKTMMNLRIPVSSIDPAEEMSYLRALQDRISTLNFGS